MALQKALITLTILFVLIDRTYGEEPDRRIDIKTYHDKVFAGWEQAKKDDKYVLVFFNSDYCGFCDRMLESVTDKRLGKYANKFVFIDTDPDYDPDAEAFVKKFKVEKYPTLLMLHPILDHATGKIKEINLIGTMTGQQSAAEMDNFFQFCFDKYEFRRNPMERLRKSRVDGKQLLLVFDDVYDPMTRVSSNSKGLQKLLFERKSGNYYESLDVCYLNQPNNRLHKNLIAKYQIDKFPTYVLVKADGKYFQEIGRMSVSAASTRSPKLDEGELRKFGVHK